MQRSRSVDHLSYITVQDEYGTPTNRFYSACLKYNLINLKIDYAASPINHVLPKYYTINDDSLSLEWNEDGFLNPPYSKVDKFLEHAYKEHLKNNITILILTYAKVDTKWFNSYVYDDLRDRWLAEFKPIRRRIQFNDQMGIPCVNKKKFKDDGTLNPNYGKPQSAPYPSCWIIYRRKNFGKTKVTRQ